MTTSASVHDTWVRVSNVRHRFQESLELSFGKWGGLTARHPLKVLICSFVVLGGLFAANLTMTHEFRGNYLWSPTNSRTYENWEFVKDNYGERHQLTLYARRPRGGNIFEVEAIRELIKAHEWTVSQCNVDSGGRRLRWKHVCHKFKSTKECASQNFLGIWNYDVDTLEDRRDNILDDVSAFHNGIASINIFSGEPRFDGHGANTEVERADGVMIQYELEGVDGDSYEFEAKWHAGIDDVINKRWLEIAHVSPRAYDDETERLLVGDAPLLAGGLIISLVYLALTLGPINSCVKSRVLLGFAALIHIALALGGGFGLAALCGVPIVPITPVLPLAVLGVQVDAVLAIVGALNAEEPAGAKLDERVSRAFGQSAPAILTTTLTAVAALVIGSTVDIPGVSHFCAYAASCFAISMIGMFTFFLSLLVLDERRLQESRWSTVPCVTEPKAAEEAPVDATAVPAAAADAAPPVPARRRRALAHDAESVAPGLFGRFVRERYTPALLTPWVSALVIIVFIVLNALCLVALPKLQLGLPDADVLPDHSYVQNALRVEQESFGGPRLQASVVLRNASIRELDVRTRLDKALDAMQGKPYVTYGFDRWHVVWKKFLQAQDSQRNDGTKYNAHKFTNGLGEWLEDTPRWLDDVVCDEPDECREPTTGRYELLYTSPPNGEAVAALKQRDNLEAELRRRDLDESFVFHESYLVDAAAAVAWQQIIANVVSAIAAVFVLMLAFAPPVVAFWITVCVLSTNILLGGTMFAIGIRLNPISFVNIVLSVALSVYYYAPIALTHEISLAGAEQRGLVGRAADIKATEYSLAVTAISVLKSGLASVLAIIVLAFASSVLFRTFFVMLAFVAIFGVLHGVVLMPCLLAHLSSVPGCGREPQPAAATATPPVAPVEAKVTKDDKPVTSAAAWSSWLSSAIGGARV